MADGINELAGMSAQTGIAVDTLAGLQIAARAGGRELQELEGILRKVTAEGLDIESVVDQIQAIEDPTKRAAKAMELLGEEGAVLVQALGDRSLSEFQDFAREFGRDTGPESVKAAAEFQLQATKLKVAFEGIVSSGLLPYVTAVIEDFSVGIIFLKELAKQSGDFSVTTDQMFANAASAAMEFRGALSGISEGISSASETWEEFRIRQALGLDNSDAIVFAQTVGDLEAATKRSTEEWKKYKEALDQIDFAQKADDIRTVIEVIDPLTGKTREIETAFVTAAEGVENLYGTTIEGSPAFVASFDLATSGIKSMDEAMEEALRRIRRLKTTERIFAGIQKSLGSVAAGGEVVSTVATGIGDAFAAFGKKSEKAAKIAFAANKAAGIADAVVKTAQAIMNTFATLPLPVALGVAPFVAATGAAQIATIAATTFDGGGGAPPAPSGAGASSPGVSDVATSGGVTKGAEEDTAMRRGTSGGGTYYRHRDLDIVARDGRRYIGGAFDPGGSTGQVRYDR
jgi:hypothetical protein